MFSLQEDESSFQFINVSYCSPQLQSLEILVVVYVIALSVITMVFAVFNMNLSSQFGAEGKVTAAASLVVLCIGWMDVLIRVSFDSSDSPNVFRWEFYWSVVYTFSTVLITSGFLYIPLVSCCIWLIICAPLPLPLPPLSVHVCVCVCVCIHSIITCTKSTSSIPRHQRKETHRKIHRDWNVITTFAHKPQTLDSN